MNNYCYRNCQLFPLIAIVWFNIGTNWMYITEIQQL